MSERNDQNFSEQEAPLKNTDNAFVQVGSNGEPQMPSEVGTSNSSKDERVPLRGTSVSPGGEERRDEA